MVALELAYPCLFQQYAAELVQPGSDRLSVLRGLRQRLSDEKLQIIFNRRTVYGLICQVCCLLQL